MISPKHFVESLQYYAKGIVYEIQSKHIFIGAQAIAFKALVTFIPVVVFGTGLLGQILQRERPFQYVEQLIGEFFPAYQTEELMQFLGRLQEVSGALTVIGVVGFVLASVTLFTTLRLVFANIFREEWHEHRGIGEGYLFDLRMVLQVGVFFFLSIFVTLILQTVDDTGLSYLLELGVEREWIRAGWRGIFTSTGAVLPFLLSTAMFFQLFYFIPIPRSEMRSAITGAVFTAFSWEVAKIAYTGYATGIGGFEAGWFLPLGETFVLAFATVFWVYFSAIVLNIGAIITLLHERRKRESLRLVDVKMGDQRPLSPSTPTTE